MLVFATENEFVIFDLQAVQEVGIDVTAIFVYQKVSPITGNRIIVSLQAVGFLQQLRETETFRSNGFIELKIEVV